MQIHIANLSRSGLGDTIVTSTFQSNKCMPGATATAYIKPRQARSIWSDLVDEGGSITGRLRAAARAPPW